MRMSWLTTVLLALAFSLVTNVQQVSAEAAFPILSSEQVAEAMADWTSKAEGFVSDSQSYGYFLTATQVPPAARLLISYQTEIMRASTSCSGVLVGSQRILTAAHCVCGPSPATWHFENATSCVPMLKYIFIKVFFPTAGLFDVVGTPIVHEAYRSPNNPIETGATVLADLAIIELADAPFLQPVALGQADVSEHPLMASFGQLSPTWFPPSGGLVAGALYQDGVQQVSKQKGLAIDPAECGVGAAADTICTNYSNSTRRHGKEMDSGVCAGDSGAPLLRSPSGSNVFTLVGIASYYHPPVRDCHSQRDTHFINVAFYTDWIHRNLGKIGPSSSVRPVCAEGVFSGPLRTTLEVGPGMIAATTFGEVTGGSERPRMVLNGVTSDRCSLMPDFGVTTCMLPALTPVELTLESAFAQITVCHRN